MMKLRMSNSVVGLTWRKLSNKHNRLEDDERFSSPRTRSQAKLEDQAEKQGDLAVALDSYSVSRSDSESGNKIKVLKRVKSVRDAVGVGFGTLRQRLRTSTRRKKRLYNTNSPYPASRNATPSSIQRRRSTRLALAAAKENSEGEVKLYSPFCIDTPGHRTPKIRMGIHQPKRFNFSSPGSFQRDLDCVSEGIRVLSNMERNLSSIIDRSRSPKCSGIRTTPGGHKSRTPQKSGGRAIFV